jgi:hypothetical protein
MVDQSRAVGARIVDEKILMIRIWVGEVAGVVRAKVKRPNRVICLGH